MHISLRVWWMFLFYSKHAVTGCQKYQAYFKRRLTCHVFSSSFAVVDNSISMSSTSPNGSATQSETLSKFLLPTCVCHTGTAISLAEGVPVRYWRWERDYGKYSLRWNYRCMQLFAELRYKPTICCDEERIPGVPAEEIRVKDCLILHVSADEEVFVGWMTSVNVNSNSAVSSSICTYSGWYSCSQ